MIRQRAYFFDSPQTTAGSKLNPNNIPTSVTFKDLLDSIAFKSESADYATETVQGLVKLASVAISKARSGAGVVLPAHLPVMTHGASATELVTPGTASYEGIKLTAVNKTDRLDYQVDFDPTSLTAKATIALTDYVTIVDSADSNKPKKVLYSALGGNAIWSDTSTIITPVTSGDSLDMGTGVINAGGYTLKAAADTYINPLAYTGNNGANLSISAGPGQHASAAKTGGILYLNGGTGVNGGVNGNTYLGWNGGSKIGSVAIGGAVQATYGLTIRENTYLDGTLYLKPTAPPGGGVTIATSIIYGSDGLLYYLTFKDFMHNVLGGTAPAGDSVLLYSGSAYSSLLIGVVKDSFLHTNASTGALEFAVMDMTDRVETSSIKATGLAPSVIIGATGSNDVVALFDKTTGQLKLGSYLSDNLGVNKAVSKTILTATTVITTPTYNQIILDSTAGEVDCTLPSPATVPDGTVIEFLQWGANLAKIVAAIQSGNGITASSYSLPGINTGVKMYSDLALGKWVIAAYYPAP